MRPGVTLYFIRHGQTDWNAASRYQGQRDIPLNDLGRSQARRNGEVLSRHIADPAAYDFLASPLSRASETMQIVRRAMGLSPIGYRTDDRLKEVHYGSWEGRLAIEMGEHDPEGVALRARDPYRFRPTGGESYADLSARTADWLDGIERDSIVASHGGVSRTLRGLLLGLDGSEIMQLEVPQDRILVLQRGSMSWL